MVEDPTVVAREFEAHLKTVSVQLPIATSTLVAGGETEVTETAHKVCDTSVRMVDRNFYGAQADSQLLADPVSSYLPCRRFSKALSGALTALFWPAIGLPTRSETAAIRRDLTMLRKELAEMLTNAPTEPDELSVATVQAESPQSQPIKQTERVTGNQR